ncbi:hypothetical protein BJX63DRAFT_323410 [Aspergillus granulosus]|uniref:Uncharacterized protein n=1 Tax=Aspergillus granulosus TaxID=176169 RepID=A0ABR4H425_9EURO
MRGYLRVGFIKKLTDSYSWNSGIVSCATSDCADERMPARHLQAGKRAEVRFTVAKLSQGGVIRSIFLSHQHQQCTRVPPVYKPPECSKRKSPINKRGRCAVRPCAASPRTTGNRAIPLKIPHFDPPLAIICEEQFSHYLAHHRHLAEA